MSFAAFSVDDLTALTFGCQKDDAVKFFPDFIYETVDSVSAFLFRCNFIQQLSNSIAIFTVCFTSNCNMIFLQKETSDVVAVGNTDNRSRPSGSRGGRNGVFRTIALIALLTLLPTADSFQGAAMAIDPARGKFHGIVYAHCCFFSSFCIQYNNNFA